MDKITQKSKIPVEGESELMKMDARAIEYPSPNTYRSKYIALSKTAYIIPRQFLNFSKSLEQLGGLNPTKIHLDGLVFGIILSSFI
jgi:hypothetical protein